MAKKNAFATTDALIARAKRSSSGQSGTTSSVSNVSNSGEMSTHTSSTGATGAVSNTTTIYQGGDPGFPSGQESEVVKKYRAMMGL